MLDKTKEEPTEQEIFEWLKRGATLNAVHMLVTYKIVLLIGEESKKNILSLK